MRFRAGNKPASLHLSILTGVEFHFPPPPTSVIITSDSFLTVLRVFTDFFSCIFGLKNVSIPSFYHVYGIRISPLISRPEIINLSSSFLTVLEVFARSFLCVSGLEISWSILILSFLWNSNFTPYFSDWDCESFEFFSGHLNFICWFFLFYFRARNKLIHSHFITFTEFEFQHFPPSLDFNHFWLFSNGLNSLSWFFFMRFRAGNKLVYPHFITFTEFEFHPLFPP